MNCVNIFKKYYSTKLLLLLQEGKNTVKHVGYDTMNTVIKNKNKRHYILKYIEYT